MTSETTSTLSSVAPTLVADTNVSSSAAPTLVTPNSCLVSLIQVEYYEPQDLAFQQDAVHIENTLCENKEAAHVEVNRLEKIAKRLNNKYGDDGVMYRTFLVRIQYLKPNGFESSIAKELDYYRDIDKKDKLVTAAKRKSSKGKKRKATKKQKSSSSSSSVSTNTTTSHSDSEEENDEEKEGGEKTKDIIKV